jgi:glutaminase
VHEPTALLAQIAAQVRPLLTHGDLPQYIPRLAQVKKAQFGVIVSFQQIDTVASGDAA